MNVLIIARCRQWLKAQLFPIVVVLIVIGGFVLLNQVLARERREKELLLYFDYALQRRLGLSRDEAFEQ